MHHRRTTVTTLLTWAVAWAIPAAASLAEPRHDHAKEPSSAHNEHAGHSHNDPLHLLHPLVTESPLPENEARLIFSLANLPDDGQRELTLTGVVELAPVRWFSVEMAAPLTHLNPDVGESETRLGNVSVGLKFATFAFEQHGLLLSAGVELGLPTGNEERGIGNDHVLEVEPWIGAGFKRDCFEWIIRVGVGIPANTNGDAEPDAELEWATSFLFHIIDHKLAALVELNGLSAFGGDEDGFDSLAITPGLRVSPFDNPDVSLGVGVRLPLTSDRQSNVETIVAMFFHF